LLDKTCADDTIAIGDGCIVWKKRGDSLGQLSFRSLIVSNRRSLFP
jgi:hypothetical protein